MKKNFKLMFIFIMMLAVAATFTGCGEQKEETVSPQEAVGNFVEQNKTSVSETDTDGEFKVELAAEGLNVVYKYTYNEQVDAQQKKLELENNFKELDESMQKLMTKMKEECPEAENIVFKYYNKDNSEIYVKSYKIEQSK